MVAFLIEHPVQGRMGPGALVRDIRMVDDIGEQPAFSPLLAFQEQDLSQGNAVEPWADSFDWFAFGRLISRRQGNLLQYLIGLLAIAQARKKHGAQPPW